MPEWRKDPVAHRWTIFAPGRTGRPTALRMPQVEGYGGLEDGVCPFCPGQEEKTPPEVFAIRGEGGAPNGPGWEVRVVPNRFPAVHFEGEPAATARGMYHTMAGVGAHEVIMETPDHHRDTDQQTPEALALVFAAYQSRLLKLNGDGRFRHIMIFKNAGALAGASLGHPHSQLLATPVMPLLVRQELRGARDYFAREAQCVFCDMLRQDTAHRDRVVFENDACVAVCPFAARFPFEVRIFPKQHRADFHAATPEEHRGLAEALIAVMRMLAGSLERPHYNWVLHTAPVRVPHPGHWQTIDRDYHWHLEIIPKLGVVAGFEWGSGCYINPTLPEDAAAILRDAAHP